MKIQTEFNAGYYIAELEEPEPEPLSDPFGQFWYLEIDTWCVETFGASDFWGEYPVTGWKRMRNKYCFTDEAKLNWFMTRWS
jgi:hypothetical protein